MQSTAAELLMTGGEATRSLPASNCLPLCDFHALQGPHSFRTRSAQETEASDEPDQETPSTPAGELSKQAAPALISALPCRKPAPIDDFRLLLQLALPAVH